MTPKTMLEWAELYRATGLCPIPLRAGKLPAIRWTEFQTRQSTADECRRWFDADVGFWGMALVCGGNDNLVRVDFDDAADYVKFGDKFPAAPRFKSVRKGGGYGILLRSDTPFPTLPQKTIKAHPKLEFRGVGSITVVPPTTGYEWVTWCPIPTIDLFGLLKTTFKYEYTPPSTSIPVQDGNDPLRELLYNTTPGERSNNLVKIASTLRARGIGVDTATELMRTVFTEHWSHEGMAWDEAMIIFTEGYKRYEHEGVRVDTAIPGAGIEQLRFSDIKRRASADRVLIDHLVLAGANGQTLIAAPTKMGKTSLLLDACISASRGEPVWGSLPVLKPLRIAFIDQELKYEQIMENMELMSELVGWPDEENFQLFVNHTGQFSITETAELDILFQRLRAFKPDLIVLDGWGWFVNQQASDPKLSTPAMAWWKAVRQSLNCAMIIIHHFKKEQSAGSVSTWGEKDELDSIEGVKRLADQSETVMVYKGVPEYDTYGLLSGRTNHTPWDPLRLIIDYDANTLTHRVVSAEEGAELFDPDTYKHLWGVSTNSRGLKLALNNITNRLGMSQEDIAKHFGVSQAQVSRWRSGAKRPSVEIAKAIAEMDERARTTPIKRGMMPRGKR